MLINYVDDTLDAITKKIFDPFGVLKTYNCTTKLIANLCGGIPMKQLRAISLETISTSKSTIEVILITEAFHVCRTIDFNLARIYNKYMRVFVPGQNIGKMLFMNQIKAAMALRFKVITTYAQGKTNNNDDWEGYVFWAKIGFQMTDIDDINDFESLMKYYHQRDLALGDLVLTEKGCDFWRREGFSWHGKFYLWQGSESMKQLKKYLQAKDMQWMLEDYA
jgi:hypothetical protein